MPRCRALALPLHCPLTSPCLPLLLLDRPLMTSGYLLTHPGTLERVLLALLCLPIAFQHLFSAH